MKYLFLASSFATVAGVFAEFVADRLQGGRVAFIPTASLNEEVTFYVEAGRKALEALGLDGDRARVEVVGQAQPIRCQQTPKAALAGRGGEGRLGGFILAQGGLGTSLPV